MNDDVFYTIWFWVLIFSSVNKSYAQLMLWVFLFIVFMGNFQLFEDGSFTGCLPWGICAE